MKKLMFFFIVLLLICTSSFAQIQILEAEWGTSQQSLTDQLGEPMAEGDEWIFYPTTLWEFEATIGFAFYNDQLYQKAFYVRRDIFNRARSALTERYGEPIQDLFLQTTWSSGQTLILLHKKPDYTSITYVYLPISQVKIQEETSRDALTL